MAEGRTLFRVFPHNILYPGIFLALTVLAINIMGDGLRDTLDPEDEQEGMTRRRSCTDARPRSPQSDACALPRAPTAAHAVEKVSFTVNPGEIVCLVGESGSGKSVIAFTVMGLLAKALKPTSGEILLEGENVLAASEARLRELRCTRMSMIFQEPMTALNPVMTCGEQIDEVLETHTRLDAAPAQGQDHRPS